MAERRARPAPKAGAGGSPRAPAGPSRPVEAVAAFLGRASWRRVVLVRRCLAGVLVVVAAVLALSPAGGRSSEVVVAARDLAPGSVVAPTDLTVATWPAELVPAGVVGVAAAEGRVLAGALRAGEPLTDLRLARAALAAAATGIPDAAAVPVRLADPDVAALLTPGVRVDVVVAAPEGGTPTVLADSAVVLTVLEPGGASAGSSARGRSALVALPRELATRVAAASLSDQVAVTLR
ncbi:SAF domain-containing protein [Pseudonocardia kujensis]|uniref:SAF domain-containing protein n=1 Tax=Pseudonocardia kujensis TaxID=1128675 RepID=UPI001E54248C|nr:SAF domain-containing protein [Pseudonocardia kujensis]MCE0763210.1 SAF domain-containing protein [Pseudonocardia kujensis]